MVRQALCRRLLQETGECIWRKQLKFHRSSATHQVRDKQRPIKAGVRTLESLFTTPPDGLPRCESRDAARRPEEAFVCSPDRSHLFLRFCQISSKSASVPPDNLRASIFHRAGESRGLLLLQYSCLGVWRCMGGAAVRCDTTSFMGHHRFSLLETLHAGLLILRSGTPYLLHLGCGITRAGRRRRRWSVGCNLRSLRLAGNRFWAS
ncbi:hypothetical protein E2C01_014035 [Portunus trituberculatus]|uniref:Uncharacterized protein n=1 Tax=Portunus trituberculatus TaxID=210409 RepID=A0A5B7DHR7_PORTR|nr:hypothetical protein [Portunus trituberculatus]